MPQYRDRLPQLEDRIFLTDGGLETTLIFHDGITLPHFASVDLMRTVEGRERLRAYYARYAAMARDAGMGFVLEAPTWRASRDWAERLGLAPEQLDRLNRDSIALMDEVRRDHESPASPMVISGCLGPRGDGYDPGRMMGADEAQTYHARQIGLFAGTEADMVAAFTLSYVAEAIGIVRAARAVNMPVAISFTLETDGRLPTGETLRGAIETVDEATDAAPVYYMINCAHPTHFESVLEDAPWMARVRGVRANASRRSHAELDNAPDLDAGDPEDFGRRYGALRRRFRGLTVLGGCCGTDERHVAQIRLACAPVPRAA